MREKSRGLGVGNGDTQPRLNMKSQIESLFSSFTFRIMAAMLIIAVVPVVTAFVIFERISNFNQNLQSEAVRSIEGVTEIYRNLVKNDASRIELLKRNITLEVHNLLYRHQITQIRFMESHDLFKADLQNLFDDLVHSNDLLVELVLVQNMKVIAHTRVMPADEENYRFQRVSLPIHVHDYANMSTPNWDENDGEALGKRDSNVPMLVASPVEENPDEEVDEASSLPSLPDSLETRELPASSRRGVQLVARFAISNDDAELYDVLGQNRFVHSSISTLENDKNDESVTEIYQTIFISIAVFVIVLAVICAMFLAFSQSRKISELSRVTKQVAEGDLEAHVEVHGHDQLSVLMTQFNAMVKDIRLAQESKAYIERMQAWQEVARRLAHEIKNPLTPIVLAVQQLDVKFDDYIDRPQKYRKLLTNAVEIVTEETETLRKLVKNFSEFARMPIPEKKETVFYEFVSQTIQQNPQFFEQAKRITVHPAEEKIATQKIEIDHELMRRVIVNIVRNGIEASRNAHFDPEIDIMIEGVGENDPSHTLCLRIIDNGPGLTEEQKSKLFMPYFTTKSDGTGLGLSIVRKIVEDHHGRISLHDRDDGQRGTQADIIL